MLDSCSIVGIFKITKICYGDMLVCLSKCTLYTEKEEKWENEEERVNASY